MPDPMNPSLGDLEDNSLGGILSRGLAADPTLGQTMPGLGEYAGHVLQGVGSTLGDIASKGPQLTKDVYEAGYSGQPLSPGEMAPRAFDVAQNVTGMASPFSVKGALGSAGGRAIVTEEGMAIKGRPFDAARKSTLEQLAKEPKGTGPMDLKAAEGLPGVEQKDIERYNPTEGRRKGVPDELTAALADPTVRAGVKQSIVDGMKMGAHKWYDTRAVREAFSKAYAGSNSDPGGEKAFAHFMDLVAATSPRSDVGTNIRNATYYLGKLLRGEPVENLPYPFGHVAQKLHKQNFRNLSAAAAEGRPGWDPIQNPKPSSFSPNLQGNLRPVTVDTHAFRNVVMRTRNPAFLAGQIRAKVNKAGKIIKQEGEGELDERSAATQSMLAKYGEKSIDKDGNTVITIRPKQLFEQGRITMDEAVNQPSFWRSQPKKNEYAAVEKFYQDLAKEHGLEPAEAQAAAWAGAGKFTGLGSPETKTFAEIMNERAEYTARLRGADPTETLYKALRGEVPLLGLGGLAAGAAAQQGQQPSLPATAEPTPRS